METRVPSARLLVLHGVIAGLLAGAAFTVVQAIISAVLGDNPLHSLRITASILTGPQVYSPQIPLVSAALVGLAVHFVLSAVYGVIFMYALSFVGQLAAPGPVLVVLGAVYAMVLWIFNFLLVAPALFPQFGLGPQPADETVFWVGFSVAHFFYGAGLGSYLAVTRPLVRHGAARP